MWPTFLTTNVVVVPKRHTVSGRNLLRRKDSSIPVSCRPRRRRRIQPLVDHQQCPLGHIQQQQPQEPPPPHNCEAVHRNNKKQPTYESLGSGPTTHGGQWRWLDGRHIPVETGLGCVTVKERTAAVARFEGGPIQ